MNIFSCDCCEYVLDADKIDWPPPYDYSGNTRGYRWNGEDYIPLSMCPLCHNGIERPE